MGDRKDEQSIDLISLLEEHNIQIKPEGYSMYPLFVPGRDSAIIAKSGTKRLKRGDVVLYRRTGSILVLHRIWRVGQEGIYMVGDNQTQIEGPLAPEQILGILIAFVRKGHTYSVKHPIYRLYAGIWLALRPVRRPISLFVAGIKKHFKRTH